MEKKHRIFVAINLPIEIRKQLAKYQDKFPELPAKWTPRDNLHITLEFLGALTDVEMANACTAVSAVSKNHKPFSIDLKKVSYGPDGNALPAGRQAPKFVWVQGEKSEELADLRNDLQEYLLEEIKFRPETRVFIPHITLARISEWEFRKIEPEERPEIGEDVDFSFYVESIDVMESELQRGGPVYNILESHQLQ